MKTLRIVLLLVLVFSFTAAPLLAQEKGKESAATLPSGNMTLSGAAVGAGLGAALTLIGAGWGFGRIGAAALESMARQPDIANRIQRAMMVIAALLEGATFFALIVCILVAQQVKF